MESKRDRESIDGFMKYGHGVLLSAAFLLKVLDQVNLASFFCIGKKIQRHRVGLYVFSAFIKKSCMNYLDNFDVE